MPWHLSKSDPRKVYDERHQQVCVCQTPEQARHIVEAVLSHQGSPAPPLRLREPATVDGPLETFEPDTCCNGPMIKAGHSGLLKALSVWTCPKCGCDWKPRADVSALRHWEPACDVMIMRTR